VIGQVEQMESSRCFRASGGELGCISVPRPASPATACHQGRVYYRGRCMKCHRAAGGCGLPCAERRSRGGRARTASLATLPRPAVRGHPPHGDDQPTASPALAVLPTRGRPRPRMGPGLPGSSTRGTITGISHDRGEGNGGMAARDRGVALEFGGPGATRRAAVGPHRQRRRPSPCSRRLVRERPDDLRARESLGYALGMLNRLAEARSGLRRGPPL